MELTFQGRNLSMNIQREEHGRKGAFFIDEDGEWIAEMTYFKPGDNTIVIDHTEVDPKLQEREVGRERRPGADRRADEDDRGHAQELRRADRPVSPHG